MLEEFSADDRIQHYYNQAKELKEKTATQTESIAKLASQANETAQDWFEYVSDAIAQLRGEQEAPAAPGKGPSPSANKRFRLKNREPEALFANVIHSTETTAVPTFTISDQAVLNEFAKTVQGLVSMLNEAGMSGHAKRLVDFAQRDMDTLNKTFALIKEEQTKAQEEMKALQAALIAAEKRVETHRKEVAEKVKSANDKAEHDIQSHVSQVESDIIADITELKRQLASIKAKELDSQRKYRLTQLEEELKNKAIDIQANYIKQVQDQVEGERGGRLSQIESLGQKEDQLEKLAFADAELLDETRKAHKLVAAIDALKRTALSGQQTQFELELLALKRLSAKTPFAKVGERQSDELIQLVTSSIQEHVAQHGITSLAQLSERFETVAREVRRAALIPDEDASMISHLLSIVLSSVMFTKKGLVAGDDVESRLARAEHYLNTDKDLESAAREINQLTGWPKRLSLDWLDEARRHLEVKQALEVCIHVYFLN